MSNAWNFRDDVLREQSTIVGFDVIAADGSIGEVTEDSIDVDASHIVVDTGFWIFGKKRILPARAITAVDAAERTVQIDLTKAEIKDAPDFVPESRVDTHDDYRDIIERYYVPWM